ncbi:POK6 protein, partial [Cnemophilus loriae]|nr:POK6 protein [Cnemophilus loriae]
KDVISHWRGAFAALGVPHVVKTDNGPGYAVQHTQQFLQLWGVHHVTGIPHSPTGQAIIECFHFM